ncbi:MAG: hypothetical protein C4518_10990 [Desulfobacteraceae bacterium]|nr:MAG: hypothetical protein C4518_10990 [Desulfobacteraceae bacterium]
MKDDISKHDRAISAIMAVFPTVETVDEFVSDNPDAASLRTFIDFAGKYGVLDAADESGFRLLIRSHQRASDECMAPENVNIESIFESRKDILRIQFSVRGLLQRINTLIASSGVDLPEISNTMISRLKREAVDTPRKRNTLRSLAFWLGHERPYLGPSWNYLSLLKLCRQEPLNTCFREGARIAFSLSSRGDVIGHEIVDWMRRELKVCIKDTIPRFPYSNWGTVHSYDLTTLYVDFPMEQDVSNPSSYQQCIRNAIALAHQIAMRWSLSAFFTQKRFMSIGIAAGDYSAIDTYLLPALKVSLPGDPVIRMTDFARQCVLINDIRAMFNQTPKQMVLFNGEILYVWWVVGMWSLIYWDFVPRLLHDPILQGNEAAVLALTRLLWFSDEITREEIVRYHPNAVTIYLRSPHNTILGIEIAKTLYYKRRYWEANEILRIIVSIYPFNLYARSFRMMIYRCLALGSTDYGKARLHFNRAEEEALYIQSNCRALNEDYYDEYAVIKLTHAMVIFRLIRVNGGRFVIPEVDLKKDDVFGLLNESEILFEKGLAVSPTGIRSLFLVACVRIIRRILKKNDNAFVNPELTLTDYSQDFVQPALDAFAALGWLREEFDEKTGAAVLHAILEKVFKTHRDSVTLSAYRPTIYYCFAVVLWDFLPRKTGKLVRRVHELLSDACQMAESMKKENLCIYSYTRCHGEMMPADAFNAHIAMGLEMIETFAGGKTALEQCPDDVVMNCAGKERKLLFMLNM